MNQLGALSFTIVAATILLSHACTTSTPTGDPGVTREGKWQVVHHAAVSTEIGLARGTLEC